MEWVQYPLPDKDQSNPWSIHFETAQNKIFFMLNMNGCTMTKELRVLFTSALYINVK